MNCIAKLVSVSLLIAFPLAGLAQSTAPADKRPENSAAKDMLGELWTKLRNYGPRLESRGSRQTATVTVGIRGSENTASELKPYWKDDRADDPAFVEEAKSFRAAQDLAEKNKPREAIQALETFMKTYPNSVFKPNAQLAIALSHTALGEKAQATAALKGFVKDYPKHPLATDANRAIETLKF